MAKPYLEELSNTIGNLKLPLSKNVKLEYKHFFSGAALSANGKICALLTPVGFGLKLPQVVRDQINIDGEGSELRFFENAPVKKEYIVLSQTILEDASRMKSLLIQSIDYVMK